MKILYSYVGIPANCSNAAAYRATKDDLFLLANGLYADQVDEIIDLGGDVDGVYVSKFIVYNWWDKICAFFKELTEW